VRVFVHHGFLGVLFLLFILNSEVMANTQGHFGKAVKVEGEVKVTRRFKRKMIKADDALMVKDRVSTGEGASLEIQMGDKNNLFITANSKVTLHHPTSDGKKKKEVMIKLMAGSIRSKLNGLKDENITFTIRSPTAVAGVRGTDFVTAYNPALGPKAFALTVLEGSVEVSGIDAATQKATASIQVKPAQRITVSETGAVQDVVKVTPEEMTQLKQEFTVSTDEVKEEKEDSKEDKKSDEKEEDKSEEKQARDSEGKDENADAQGEEKSDDGSDDGDKKASPSGENKTEEGTSEEGGDQKSDSGGDTGAESEGKPGEPEDKASSPGGAQETTSTGGDDSNPSTDNGESTGSKTTTAGPAPLDIETVDASEGGESTSVETEVDVGVKVQDPAVDTEVKLDLEQVDTSVNQASGVVEDVVNDQIQDQIDAINSEVGRTLRLIIRQGD
jgi:hypothetical protein